MATKTVPGANERNAVRLTLTEELPKRGGAGEAAPTVVGAVGKENQTARTGIRPGGVGSG